MALMQSTLSLDTEHEPIHWPIFWTGGKFVYCIAHYETDVTQEMPKQRRRSKAQICNTGFMFQPARLCRLHSFRHNVPDLLYSTRRQMSPQGVQSDFVSSQRGEETKQVHNCHLTCTSKCVTGHAHLLHQHPSQSEAFEHRHNRPTNRTIFHQHVHHMHFA